jgi:hypothetical protein
MYKIWREKAAPTLSLMMLLEWMLGDVANLIGGERMTGTGQRISQTRSQDAFWTSKWPHNSTRPFSMCCST